MSISILVYRKKVLSKCIGIGIGNAFWNKYWYWYCRYFQNVWL